MPSLMLIADSVSKFDALKFLSLFTKLCFVIYK